MVILFGLINHVFIAFLGIRLYSSLWLNVTVVISRLDVSLGLLGVVIVAHLSVVVVHRIGSLLLSCNVLFAKDLLNLGYFFTLHTHTKKEFQ